MASRADILRAVRSHPVPPAELPDLRETWITYSDRARQFATLVEAVGGRCIFVATIDALNRELAQLQQYTAAK